MRHAIEAKLCEGGVSSGLVPTVLSFPMFHGMECFLGTVIVVLSLLWEKDMQLNLLLLKVGIPRRPSSSKWYGVISLLVCGPPGECFPASENSTIGGILSSLWC